MLLGAVRIQRDLANNQRMPIVCLLDGSRMSPWVAMEAVIGIRYEKKDDQECTMLFRRRRRRQRTGSS